MKLRPQVFLRAKSATFLGNGAPGRTPMRPTVVKPSGFLSSRAHLHLDRERDSKGGAPRWRILRRRQRSGRAAGSTATIKSWRLRIAGAAWLPRLLLSVSVRGTEHQRLMGEAWERAPLLELGVTSVNPSCRRALAPAHRSLTRDRRVVPSDLHRFQLGAVWNSAGL
jgi:hypothetical protein